jgi:hypothetical protein
MPSPTYSQNKASIMRYREKNYEKVLVLNREYTKLSMRRIRAYKAEVKRLLNILVNFFDD